MSSVSSESHEAIDHKTSIKYAGTFDVLCLGLTIVIGGQVYSWNPLLLSGFWESLTGLLSTALMYFCLVFCISEMTSALPFSGGSYGFVRVCIGPFFGYVIGCCEALQNVAYVVSAVIPLAQMLSLLLKMDHTYEPLTWVFFFLTALAFNILGKNYFWKFNLVIGMVSLVLIVLYIASTIQYVEFDKFSGVQDYSFDGGDFMTYLPYCAWFFMGIEGLPLTCVDCAKPAKEIPYAMVGCMIILFFSGMGVFFVSLSQSPGIHEVANATLPLNFGYCHFLGISEDTATWLAIPAAHGTGFGFMFMYGRQMSSMSRSGLFPAIFKLRTKFSHTPYASLAFGSLVAVLGVIIIHTTDPAYLEQVFLVCVLSTNVMKRGHKKGRKAGSVGRASVFSGSSVALSTSEAVATNTHKRHQIIPCKENENEEEVVIEAEEFIEDMNTHLNARSCDETTPGDIESGKTHEKQQQVQPAELITRTNRIMWSSKMPELISNNKVAPIVISHPPPPIDLVGLEGVIDSPRSTKILVVRNNTHPDSILRKSFLHSLSEKVQEVFQDMKLVPLLPDDQRRPYEELVIADMCGKLSENNED
eukprot:gene2991-3182_t